MRTFAVFAILILAAEAALADPVELPIVVDGASYTVPVYSIDGTTEARSTDVIPVRKFLVTRGTEPTLRFRSGPGRLWQIGADGHEWLVAATAAALRPDEAPEGDDVDGGTSQGGLEAETDVLLTLSAAEAAGLRGVRVCGGSAATARRLETLDLAHVAILVAGRAHERVPPLPAGVRYLVFGGGPSRVGPDDLQPLASLRGLHLLVLGRAASDVVTDLAPLASLAELRRLSLSGRRVQSFDPLGKLAALRALDLTRCADSLDLGFAKGLGRLRVLELGGTRAADLSPLAGLAELRTVDARQARVRTLPAGPLPVLRELNLLGTPVRRDLVAAFRAAHPACRVDASYRDVLLEAVGAVDRIRVRTGGTGHRQPGEKTLVEVTKPEDVAALVDLLRFEDTEPAAYCMCCGRPTFELYRGNELRASLGFHHGLRFRWSDGRWPGDAPLTEEAGERLSAWLAVHGDPVPKRERDEGATARAKARRRSAREAEMLPVSALDEFVPGNVLDAESGRKVLRRHVPDASALRLLAFRLIGCAAGVEGGIQIAAYRVLEHEPLDEVVATAVAALADPEAARGVGYWVLYHRDRKGIPDGTLDELLTRAGLSMLTDADPDVRGAAIQGLGWAGRPAAVPLLRRALAGRLLTREPEDAATAGVETLDNLVRVVDALIDLADAESLPRMREIASGWSESERKRFEERVEKRFPKPR